MLYGLILVVHVLACFFLVAVILLQAGRGGGLADTFGGAAQSMFGTRGAAYLTRATTGFAILFILTSLTLAILSAQRGRSLLEGVPPAVGEIQTTLPTPPAAPEAPAASEAPAAPEAAAPPAQPSESEPTSGE